MQRSTTSQLGPTTKRQEIQRRHMQPVPRASLRASPTADPPMTLAPPPVPPPPLAPSRSRSPPRPPPPRPCPLGPDRPGAAVGTTAGPPGKRRGRADGPVGRRGRDPRARAGPGAPARPIAPKAACLLEANGSRAREPRRSRQAQAKMKISHQGGGERWRGRSGSCWQVGFAVTVVPYCRGTYTMYSLFSCTALRTGLSSFGY